MFIQPSKRMPCRCSLLKSLLNPRPYSLPNHYYKSTNPTANVPIMLLQVDDTVH